MQMCITSCFIHFKIDTIFHNTTHQSLSFFPLCFVHSACISQTLSIPHNNYSLLHTPYPIKNPTQMMYSFHCPTQTGCSLKPSTPSRKDCHQPFWWLHWLPPKLVCPPWMQDWYPIQLPTSHTYKHLHKSSNYSLMEISHWQLPPPSNWPTSLPFTNLPLTHSSSILLASEHASITSWVPFNLPTYPMTLLPIYFQEVNLASASMAALIPSSI